MLSTDDLVERFSDADPLPRWDTFIQGKETMVSFLQKGVFYVSVSNFCDPWYWTLRETDPDGIPVKTLDDGDRETLPEARRAAYAAMRREIARRGGRTYE